MAEDKYDLLGQMMAYEEEGLDFEETLELFGVLIKDDMVHQLQGSYGRGAESLIDSGFLTPDGDVTDFAREVVENF